MKTLHPLIPHEIVDGLDVLLDEVKFDLGFKEFDEESSPQVYQGLITLYFFSLGSKINQAGKIRTVLGDDLDMLYQLEQEKLISAKPKNYRELKETFGKLFEKTSDYLRKI